MTLLGIEKNGRQKKHRYRCDVCQHEFLAYKKQYQPNSGKDCCSVKCRGVEWSQRSRITLTCEVCGKSFERRKCHAAARVCSVKCRSKILPQTSIDPTKWVVVSCSVCNADVKKRKRDVGMRTYCCKECHSKGKAQFCSTNVWRSKQALGFKRGSYTTRDGRHFKYDSSYELRRMKELDYEDRQVEAWTRCEESIPYTTPDGTSHHYNPDFFVTLKNGTHVIEETKGKITDVDLIKIKAGRQFASQRGWQYKLIQYDSKITSIEPKLSAYQNEFGKFIRPSEETIFMNMAMIMAERSTCLRKKVAAVFTDESMRRVLCFGYNGNVAGGENGCDSLEEGACGCIHAEINALTKNVATLEGATCFVTLSPCLMCAKVLVNRGIKKVIYYEKYRTHAGLNLLQKHGVEVIKFSDLPETVSIEPDTTFRPDTLL